MMWYRESPSLLGPSPTFSLTFVAITTSSRWSFRSSPTISSDLPLEYTFAVSKKFMPRSRERFTIGLALSISTIHSSELPKDIVPRQMRETWSPVGPSWEYCIERRGRSTRFPCLRVPWVCPEIFRKRWVRIRLRTALPFQGSVLSDVLACLLVGATPWTTTSAAGSATAHLTLHPGNSVTKVKYLTRRVP